MNESIQRFHSTRRRESATLPPLLVSRQQAAHLLGYQSIDPIIELEKNRKLPARSRIDLPVLLDSIRCDLAGSADRRKAKAEPWRYELTLMSSSQLKQLRDELRRGAAVSAALASVRSATQFNSVHDPVATDDLDEEIQCNRGEPSFGIHDTIKKERPGQRPDLNLLYSIRIIYQRSSV